MFVCYVDFTVSGNLLKCWEFIVDVNVRFYVIIYLMRC